MAARLYASGAVPTKRAACEAVGLSPTYLTVLSENEVTTRIMSEVERAIADETVALSKVVAMLSRRALGKMDKLIDSANEHVALKASSDILDRNPETSKTMKHSVSGLILSGEDAKELAEALVAGARVKEQYAALAAGDFVKVEVEANGTERGNGSSGATHDREGGEAETKERVVLAAPDEGQATEGAETKFKLLGDADG